MIALLIATAAASTRELTFEVGWVRTDDPRFGLLGGEGALGSYGLRGGYPVHPHFALVGGWQHSTLGGEIVAGEEGDYVEEYEEEYDGEYDGVSSTYGAIRTGFWGDQLSLGIKADKMFGRVFGIYGALQGVGMHALVMLDADEDHNGAADPTEITAHAWTGGVIATGGVEFIIPLGKSGWGLGLTTELGYQWLAPMEIERVGAMQLAGFAGRVGLGLRL